MKSGKSIKRKMLFIGLLPILVLSVLIVSVGMILLYRSYVKNIQDELESTTNALLDCLDLAVDGDYSYSNEVLFKGELNMSDFSLMKRMSERSGIDTTIFWNDIRILTTVKDESGVLAEGTRASKEVSNEVLLKGNNYYSNNVDVNGMRYIGYYMPLVNSDNKIIGMVFAGKNRQQVFVDISKMLEWFALFSAIAVFMTVFLNRIFSNRLVEDIDGINDFLATISKGDLDVSLDGRIVRRNDELGMIGQYASNMCNDLKKLIEEDPLTGLLNRRSGTNRLKAIESDNTEYSIVMCDIDWFKSINDTYGHDAGDCVLVAISELLKENIKDCGFASRWGGEEFLVIYQLDANAVREKVEGLQRSVRECEFIYGADTIKVTLTFGVESEYISESYEKRIKRADDKLYIGKNNGRNQIVF